MNAQEITQKIDIYLDLFRSGKLSGLELADLTLKLIAKEREGN
jgi:hypothetical protein